MGELIAIILIVIVGSGLCSGSEAALFAVTPARVQQMAEAHQFGASALARIKANMGRPIATLVIINNIFNIVGSIIIGDMAGRLLGSEWLGVLSGILTFLIIIFAEILPKTLGELFAPTIGRVVAPAVEVLSRVLYPLVVVIEWLLQPVYKWAQQIRSGALDTNEAEIRVLARMGEQKGSIEADEVALIDRIFNLNDVTAGDLMTPRGALTYLHGTQTLGDAAPRIMASEHTRILITVEDSLDNLLGVARKDDMLAALVAGEHDRYLRDMAKETAFCPEMIKADSLLEMFRKQQQHLIVVIDEHGGVAGVVTLEDVVEVLLDEITDETDTYIDLRKRAQERFKERFPERYEGDDDLPANNGNGSTAPHADAVGADPSASDLPPMSH